jgi:cobalt-zinc-cadmium efflux system outer membrane protein
LVFASLAFQMYAQSTANNPPPASVTVQTSEATLAAPPSIGAQLSAQEPSSKAAELFAPVTKANMPKNFVKSAPSGPVEMDLRQLWEELKLNNPQLASLRESYLSAKATVPQIAAPANPQVGLVWSGMPVNSPFALGGANAPSPQYPQGISSNNSISFAQPFQFPGKKGLAADIADTNAEALLASSESTYLQLGAQLSTSLQHSGNTKAIASTQRVGSALRDDQECG